MKKPKDVAELASRLQSAASTPLVPPPVIAATPAPASTEATAPKPVREPKRRKSVKRGSVAVFLRVPVPLFEDYDGEAVRRTKETGRGVTVQQVMLDRLEKARADA